MQNAKPLIGAPQQTLRVDSTGNGVMVLIFDVLKINQHCRSPFPESIQLACKVALKTGSAKVLKIMPQCFFCFLQTEAVSPGSVTPSSSDSHKAPNVRCKRSFRPISSAYPYDAYVIYNNFLLQEKRPEQNPPVSKIISHSWCDHLNVITCNFANFCDLLFWSPFSHFYVGKACPQYICLSLTVTHLCQHSLRWVELASQSEYITSLMEAFQG